MITIEVECTIENFKEVDDLN